MKIKHISEQHGVREIEGKRERENSLQDVRRLFIYRASTHRHAWSHARVHATPTANARVRASASKRTRTRFPRERAKSPRRPVYFLPCLLVNARRPLSLFAEIIR